MTKHIIVLNRIAGLGMAECGWFLLCMLCNSMIGLGMAEFGVAGLSIDEHGTGCGERVRLAMAVA